MRQGRQRRARQNIQPGPRRKETPVQHLQFWKDTIAETTMDDDEILHPVLSTNTDTFWRGVNLFSTKWVLEGANPNEIIQDQIVYNTCHELADILKSNNARGVYRTNITLFTGGTYSGTLRNFGEPLDILHSYDEAIAQFTLLASRQARIVRAGGASVGISNGKSGNHCLFKALNGYRSIIEHNDDPKLRRTAVEFKKWLKLPFDAYAPLTCIEKIERAYKVKIHVCGDVQRPSQKNYPVSITISLINEHYEYVKSYCKSVGEATADSYYFNLGKRMNINIKNHTHSTISFVEDYTDNDALHKAKNSSTVFKLADLRMNEEQFSIAQKTLLQEFNIPVHHAGNLNSLVLWMFSQSIKGAVPKPEFIDYDEENLIQTAMRGGYMASLKPGTYEDAVSIDINSSYANVLNSRHFPTSAGEWQTLDELPEHPKYGYYYVVVNHDNTTPRIITHIELINNPGTYTLVSSNQNANAYIYEKTLPGSKIFGEYVKRCLAIKANPATKSFGKQFLSTLVGRLIAKTSEFKTKMLGDGKIMYLNDDHDMINFTMYSNNKIQFEMRDPKDQLYRMDWARIGPFAYDFARYDLINMMRKIGIENCYYVHTDSITLERRVYEDFAAKNPKLFDQKKLGCWKLEKQGKVLVKTTCRQVWS